MLSTTMRRGLSTKTSGARSASRIGATWESFFTPAHRVVLSTPATTSNLGPGFDSLGLALDLRNHVVIERADEFSISVYGEGEGGEGMIPETEANLVVQSCYAAIEQMGKSQSMPPLRNVEGSQPKWLAATIVGADAPGFL